MRFVLDPLSPNGVSKAPTTQNYQPYFVGGQGKPSLLDSVNGKHGAVEITGGSNVTIDNSGKEIIISATGGSGGGLDNVVEDTSPQLGGDLDANGFDITVGVINTVSQVTEVQGDDAGNIQLNVTNVNTGGSSSVTHEFKQGGSTRAQLQFLRAALTFYMGGSSNVHTVIKAGGEDAITIDRTTRVATFSSDPIIPDEAYGAGWNGSLEPPTKNAVYDKIETISGGGVSESLAIAYAVSL